MINIDDFPCFTKNNSSSLTNIYVRSWKITYNLAVYLLLFMVTLTNLLPCKEIVSASKNLNIDPLVFTVTNYTECSKLWLVCLSTTVWTMMIPLNLIISILWTDLDMENVQMMIGVIIIFYESKVKYLPRNRNNFPAIILFIFIQQINMFLSATFNAWKTGKVHFPYQCWTIWKKVKLLWLIKKMDWIVIFFCAKDHMLFWQITFGRFMAYAMEQHYTWWMSFILMAEFILVFLIFSSLILATNIVAHSYFEMIKIAKVGSLFPLIIMSGKHEVLILKM